jgi:3-(3-hydroxy-phenyl)propionate hydroxylase
VDPADALTAPSLAWWRALGARFVRIHRPRSGPGPGLRPAAAPASQTPPAAEAAQDATAVEDVDGAFRDWLLERPGDEIIVLRPDRYVAAVCDRTGFEATTQALRSLLHGEGALLDAG